ncbi:MAG: hypothetical protein AB7G21_14810, partial [Dehalococcoidia bacterium]
VDDFDARYTGVVPQMLIPWHYWRCMDGNLMECSGWGAGHGFLHCAELDFSEAPQGPMADNCKKEGRIIQWAYVSTLGYIWGCKDGIPVIVGQKAVDSRGFDSAVWRIVPRGIPFSDPFSHCRAYGTDDRGYDHYRYPFGSFGPAVFPEPFGLFGGVGRWTWRCADGDVLVCPYGSNLPCWKADTDPNPSPELKQFCNEAIGRTPPADQPPSSMTKNSAYSWQCANGLPVSTPRNDIDERSYFATLWTRIPDPGPPYYDDPFTYCAAAVTVKPPGARYIGEQYPDGVGQKFWWCEGGAVFADGMRLARPSPTPAAPR